jgi:hypothetical protein
MEPSELYQKSLCKCRNELTLSSMFVSEGVMSSSRRPHQDTSHVANVSFKCFRYFKGMLQMFHMDVAKVNRDIAHVIMVVYLCFKCMFCFRRMLQVFYLDVAKVDLNVTYICKCFRCFHTYVVIVFIWML